jgi:hypothetical protein
MKEELKKQFYDLLNSQPETWEQLLRQHNANPDFIQSEQIKCLEFINGMALYESKGGKYSILTQTPLHPSFTNLQDCKNYFNGLQEGYTNGHPEVTRHI